VNQQRIIEQLDTMVVVLAGVRARHAQVHTDAAVAGGTMSQAQAEAYLERVRNGDHSRELRAHIRG